MKVVAFVPDLMDRSRISNAVSGASFVTQPSQLVDAGLGAGDVALVDLGRPGALEALPGLVASGARVIAFGAHVERETLDAARAAGGDAVEVLPRSAFFRSLGDLVNPT